jgi:hypothetical protein
MLLACRSSGKMRRVMAQQQQVEEIAIQVLESVKEMKKQLAPRDEAEAFVQGIEQEADRVRRKAEQEAQQQGAVLVLKEEEEPPREAA